MSTLIPTTEPAFIRAGDSLAWDRVVDGHTPADGWALTYVLRGPGLLTIAATGAGDHFAVRLSGSQTEQLPAGLYRLIGRVSRAGARFTVYDRSVIVSPDPVMAAGTHAEQMVALLQAQERELAAKASVQSWSQGGRSETMAALTDVRRQLGHYYEQVRIERGGAVLQPMRVSFGGA